VTAKGKKKKHKRQEGSSGTRGFFSNRARKKGDKSWQKVNSARGRNKKWGGRLQRAKGGVKASHRNARNPKISLKKTTQFNNVHLGVDTKG